MIVVGIAGAWIAGSLMLDPQDQCTFGPVSNARYQEWLAKAKALRSREGPLLTQTRILVGPGYRAGSELLFEELSRAVTSVEERIAIVHAMMRAEGLRLLSTYPDLEDPYPAAESRVGFYYGQYSWFGLLLLCQFDCMNRAFANLYIRDELLYRRNSIEISYSRGPELVSLTRYRVPPPRFPRTCPPMPSPEWAARLIAPENP